MTFLSLSSLLSYFLLAWAVARRTLAEESLWLNSLMTGVLGLAFLEITVGILGRFLPWEYALWAGGAIGLMISLFLLRLPPRPVWLRLTLSFSLENIFLFLIFAVSSALVVKMSLRFSINDEVGMQGHQAFVETILRGNFPPRFIAFPQVPYRYHYGFTLLAAIFSRSLDIPGFLGIDVLAILLWVLMLGTMLLLLNSLGIPKKWLGWGLLFLVFAGGWSWFLAKGEAGGFGPGYQAPQWQLMYIRHRFIAPNLVVYFFQHPMSLGIPLMLSSLYFFDRWNRKNRPVDLALSALLLGALSLAQVMLFLTTLAAYGVIFFVNFFNPRIQRKKNFLAGFFMGICTITLAFALGGFFSFSSDLDPQPLVFSWPPGYLRNEYWGRLVPIDRQGSLIYYFSSFGLMLLLWPFALYRGFRSERILPRFLAINSLIGFLCP
ncbi:MAG TPA: hypothetical protein DF383_08545, partial [Deltaproteobacteria bacterium]|nr:hypothetical protein [Deltaproteobacteria bacterium]